MPAAQIHISGLVMTNIYGLQIHAYMLKGLP
jgi:hypothetical protein